MSQHPLRLFINNAFIQQSDIIVLDSTQSHYLSTVMRRSYGEIIHIFNGKDGLWEAEIASHPKKRTLLTLRLGNQIKPQPEIPPIEVFQVFGLIKKWDDILNQGTQLHAHGFYPCKSQHSVVRNFSTQRGQRIIYEACEQSGTLLIPKLFDAENFLKIGQALDALPEPQLHFVCEFNGLNWSNLCCAAKQWFAPIPESSPIKIFLWIGPEGGWSVEEIQFFKEKQLNPHCKNQWLFAQLHPQSILRAETAAIVGLTMIQNILLESTLCPTKI